MKALDGIVILDLTHMLSGPYGAMLLTDLGARTIKVEPVGEGEKTRTLLARSQEYSRQGMGAYFLTLNRGKESICLDLKNTLGLATFYKLVANADIVLDNFGAGVTKRLKIDHDSLAKINPRIITCTVTGFGETGPDNRRPAFDQIAQGMGGGMSITGLPDGPPVRAGIPIGDLGGGVFGALGVLSALFERERTNVGQHLDISMLDVQISLLNYMATMYLMSGNIPGRIGNAHFVHVPYNSYKTVDGYIIIACIGDEFFKKLRDLLDIPEFHKPEYEHQHARLTDREKIDEILQQVIITNTTTYWLEKLKTARIPCAPVNTFAEALTDPQIVARNMIMNVKLQSGEDIQMPGNPIKSSTDSDEAPTPPPYLGEHTNEVLTEFLGCSAAELEQLREAGAIQ